MKLTKVATSRPGPKPKVIKETSKPAKSKIIVSIDYGTTYSGKCQAYTAYSRLIITGVAFVMSVNSDARDIQVVTDWTGGVRKNVQLEKVPSKYAYARENEGLEEDKWGYEVEPWMKSYTWTKLLLDASAAQTRFDNPHLQSQVGNGLLETPSGATAIGVASDYLSRVYEHTMDRLAKVYSKEMLKITPVEFWFTVPASWQDEANNATREAAEAAGFASRKDDELYMISEPEAAAMAILTEAIDKNPGLYKV